MEAATFCIMKGFTEEFISSLDIEGFGDLYMYVRRIDARQRLAFVSDVGNAVGGTKKSRKEHHDNLKEWLPKQETREIGTASDFKTRRRR